MKKLLGWLNAKPIEANQSQSKNFVYDEVMKLVLWDVDGTLILNSPNPKNLHKLAVETYFGFKLGVDFSPVPGMTDFGLIDEICRVNSLSVSREVCQGIMKILDGLSIEDNTVSYREQENARMALTQLVRLKSINSLQTGNSKVRATKKLEKLNLTELIKKEFSFYGSAAKNKQDIISRSAFEDLRRRFSEIFIVGDTVDDIMLGKQHECRTIAFINGEKYQTNLLKTRPDFVVKNLLNVVNIVRE